ncbi:MAG: trimethylamine methyltransferase family protein [Lachnospiraceae bacterium]|nr:trimethylamine methyltransferase family protein [Lachnospiraceae bacterium]
MNRHNYGISEQDIQLIHEKSMFLLARNGVQFRSKTVLELFQNHGFHVNGDIVYMQEKDIWNAFSTVPKSFIWTGRETSVEIGGKKQIFGPSYGPVYVLENDIYHKSNYEDFIRFQQLNETSTVMQIMNPNILDLSFLKSPVYSEWAQAMTLTLSTKPVMGMVDSSIQALHSIRMTKEFYGTDHQIVVCGLVNMESPFCYPDYVCDAITVYASEGQCIILTPSAMSGITAPDSLSGLLLVNNTEILAGIVLTQLINPGVPVLYGNQSHSVDLRSCLPIVGSAEQSLIYASVKAFGDFYGIPVRTGGATSDAKLADMQSGAESCSNLLASVTSGADLVLHTCGVLSADLGISFDKYIYDEEILQSVQRFSKGIDVSEEALQIDKILSIGPGRNYLDRTSKYYRNDYRRAKIPDRESYAFWMKHGAETFTNRTRAAYLERLNQYETKLPTREQMEVLLQYVPGELLRP